MYAHYLRRATRGITPGRRREARLKENFISWAIGTTGRKVATHMNEKKMRVLSVINLKGGVAKTISSVAIAYILAEVYSFRCPAGRQ